jgi:hypothetical protein
VYDCLYLGFTERHIKQFPQKLTDAGRALPLDTESHEVRDQNPLNAILRIPTTEHLLLSLSKKRSGACQALCHLPSVQPVPCTSRSITDESPFTGRTSNQPY